MLHVSAHDAVVVGSGPNGLSAAIALCQSGRSVLVLEAEATIGGGAKTAELTLPGFRHDPCSAIHPLALASPFFTTLPLARYGLEWLEPPIALAHPFDDGTAAILTRSIDETADSLTVDGSVYRRLMTPLVADFTLLTSELLAPLHMPQHPIALARFGLLAIRSAGGLARSRFAGEAARAFFVGMANHSMAPLTSPATAAFGLVLALFGHGVGWPIPRGGSQSISDALAAHLRSLGGEIETGARVRTLERFASSRAVLMDVTPRQFVDIAGDDVPASYRARLERYRYGPGAFKVDWALSGPVPWTASACRRAGTIHLGGTFEEIMRSAAEVAAGRHPEEPYVIVAQQGLFDSTRAPAGKQTLWAYCHVPNGSTVDTTERIERQIERFAPGFRDLILARAVRGPAELESHNANDIGGDINGGLQDIRQLFTRPTVRLDPYSTPNRRLYLCSSSTPPGGGVHGMCGFHAAKSALRNAWERSD